MTNAVRNTLIAAGILGAAAFTPAGQHTLESVMGSFSSALERGTSALAAPPSHRAADAIRDGTVGYTTLAPEPNEGLYHLMGRAYTWQNQDQRDELAATVRQLNHMDGSALQQARAYTVPVDAAHRAQYNLE